MLLVHWLAVVIGSLKNISKGPSSNENGVKLLSMIEHYSNSYNN